MRVLFVSSPGLGHLFPLIPLAWGFRASGHEVVIAIAEHAGRAAQSGLEVVDVAPHFSSVAAFEQVAKDDPDFVTTVATRPAVDLAEWGVQIGAVNRPLIDGVIQLTDDFKPDLVIYEQGATAGLFAAARAGVPAVQRNHGAFATGRMHDAIAGFLGDFFDKYDLPNPLPKPDVVLESFPPSMILDRAPEGWFMRWVPYAGGQVHGDRWPTAPPRTRPQVAVSMGTIELQAFGLGAIESIIAAAAEVDADFVLALGDLDVGPLKPLPRNVTAVGWTTLHRLLRGCDAVVHHGSGGMIMTAIEAGIPQLLAPDARDMFQHSGRAAVGKLGIGLVSSADEVSPELLRQLLADQQLARQMTAVRDEMHALPSPAETARRIIAEL